MTGGRDITQMPSPGTTSEPIPVGSLRPWLAPAILGTLGLALVFLLYLGPFWESPPLGGVAIALTLVGAAILLYIWQWRRRRALTCAPDGLHVRTALREVTVPWSDVAEVTVGRNQHYSGRDNWNLVTRGPDGRTIRAVTDLMFTDQREAEQARTTILRWRDAHARAPA